MNDNFYKFSINIAIHIKNAKKLSDRIYCWPNDPGSLYHYVRQIDNKKSWITLILAHICPVPIDPYLDFSLSADMLSFLKGELFLIPNWAHSSWLDFATWFERFYTRCFLK